MRRLSTMIGLGVPMAWAALPAHAQVRVQLDRADPTITEKALPERTPGVAQSSAPVSSGSTKAVPDEALGQRRIAAAIIVDGNREVPTSAFASVLAPYLGRNLSGNDLSQLASAVANIVRARGYPFASASIERQTMTDGILHVTLDEGQIAAVRVIGAINPLADQMLTKALVTGLPVRQTVLERAILLIGDIAGVRVKDSRYVRQNGFGILLVTIVEDKATAYVQLDNRGSAEVGPLRATLLANYRGLAGSGDELGLIAAVTPVQPSEFAFLRARYSAPVDLHGAIVTVSASYGHVQPGGSLKPLDVVGNSVDLAVGYAHPLVRSRARSLWGNIEFRALKTDQTLLGSKLRDDRLATITASFNGATRLGPGTMRGEVSVVEGLPLDGVTHQGDPLTSRADGDARFVISGYTVDWVTDLGGPFAIALASSGQLASRPLLATAEIGVGGPSFGRAYDYAERTGDQGILGSVELRANLGRVSEVVNRLQLYGFVDGGHVGNLRGGVGGGSLLSTGTGARFALGPLDSMLEIAFPVNEDRFDTGSKRPRVSFRLSRGF